MLNGYCKVNPESNMLLTFILYARMPSTVEEAFDEALGFVKIHQPAIESCELKQKTDESCCRDDAPIVIGARQVLGELISSIKKTDSLEAVLIEVKRSAKSQENPQERNKRMRIMKRERDLESQSRGDDSRVQMQNKRRKRKRSGLAFTITALLGASAGCGFYSYKVKPAQDRLDLANKNLATKNNERNRIAFFNLIAKVKLDPQFIQSIQEKVFIILLLII
eukprot:NODE_186_length_13589_cov_0.385545.p10 type:complete len:222 gc:universal NODE_186_length_13589_cov_0.385545:883-218(-)